jgi:hypothetical protein
MIPLLPSPNLSAAAIREHLLRSWPDIPPVEQTPAGEGQASFSIGAETCIIQAIRAAIPWGDLAEPCRVSWMWPDAEEKLRACTAHLIVTVLSDAGPVERARRLTQVAAAILATCPEAPGVFWTNAELIVPSNLFQEFTTQILPQGPPLYAWVDFRVGSAGKGRSSGYTNGLKAFGQMEFETDNATESPGDLRERLFSLASYVLTQGAVIRDGDTVGQNARERIRVVYGPSRFGLPGQVMRLDYAGGGGGLMGLFRR